MIDANANRARESLRVLEDIARFALDDQARAAACKTLRHEITAAIRTVAPTLLEARDTPADVGTALTAEGETSRHSLFDVARAAEARLGEAMRVLEECCKIESPSAAATLKSLRYRGYTVAGEIAGAAAASRKRSTPQWRVCLLLTRGLCRQPWQDVLLAAMDAGVDAVQVREKCQREKHQNSGEHPGLCDRELLGHIAAVRSIISNRAAVIINDRVDLALMAGADGVHLGQDDVPLAEARTLAGSQLLIGISTHSLAQAAEAERGGANMIGIGPMYPSATKPLDHIAGPDVLESVAQQCALPHLAIGGITFAHVAALRAAGCRGIAVSSAICASEHPESAARQLVKAME